MGVYIKGMEMPYSCLDCDFSKVQTYEGTIRCCVPSEESFGENVIDYVTARAQFCPLVEVKTPHGKLVDFGNIKYKGYTEAEINDLFPTVIEEEEHE